VRVPLGGVARGGTEYNILLGITDDLLENDVMGTDRTLLDILFQQKCTAR
jgi:hypothetical protein